MANENFLQLPSVTNAQLTDVIAAVQSNITVKETLQQVLDLVSNNIVQFNLGSPNGQVAGDTYNFCFDSFNKILYVCTTSGSSLTAVWTNITDSALIAGTNIVLSTSPAGTVINSTGAPTPAALTEVNDTNVTLTLGGSPSTALLEATSITAGWTGQLGLSRGGTNNNLTANAGGVVYSTSTGLAIAPPPLINNANYPLISGAGGTGTPTWSSILFPSVSTANRLFWSPMNNEMDGLPSAPSSVLVTNAGSIPSWSTTLPSAITIPQPLIQGVTNGSSAASGIIGQQISSVISSGSLVTLTSGVSANVTSISLPAGSWDVWGNVTLVSSLGMGSYEVWINNASATAPDSSLVSSLSIISQLISSVGVPVPSLTFNLSTPTTIYLSALVGFPSGTCGACGGIYARRRY